jgi:2-keto-3-deoxy-L-rhamnonate aldolase RhmA
VVSSSPAFPNLEVVLQGSGVEVILVGDTDVSVTGCAKVKALTNAQNLKKALKACKKDKKKGKRQSCVRHARKEFSPSKKAKK